MMMALQHRYERRGWPLIRPPLHRKRFRQALTNHLECNRSDWVLCRCLLHICFLWRGRAQVPREPSLSPYL
jgi:hypothetical protein